jgi:hypothetical protein
VAAIQHVASEWIALKVLTHMIRAIHTLQGLARMAHRHLRTLDHPQVETGGAALAVSKRTSVESATVRSLRVASGGAGVR